MSDAHTRSPRRPSQPAPRQTSVQPLSPRELDELQALLDAVPAPLEPLDVSMLDGFLCGVLLQPQHVLPARWLPHVTDADGRVLPARFDARRLHELALRRHAELNDAISRRQWFDPWVFELEEEPGEAAPQDDGDVDGYGDDYGDDHEGESPGAIDAVYPWVAGLATALETFPGLMALDEGALTEPLALLYRHLGPDDLEDADALLAEIETLEPAADLTEAVEDLVRAVLLLADISRPQASARSGKPAPRRYGPPGAGRPRRPSNR